MGKYKIEMKWAFIFVAMSLIWMLLEKITGLHDQHIRVHSTFSNFIAIPAIATYVFALLDKRNSFYSGQMSYIQGLVCGLIITLIVTILSPLTQIITSKIITPEFFTNAINYTVSSGSLTKEAAEEYFSLKNYIIQGLIGAPIMGIFTSAIVAIFVRKTKT